MSGFYDSLDLYIQPSKQEGLPRAVIEAMSRGCPVIGTNIAGIPEPFAPECLFKKSSARVVQESIEKIVSSNMRKLAKENFQKAQNYEKDKLEKKREKFMKIS